MEAIVVKPKNKEAFNFLKKLLSSLKEVSSFEVINIEDKKQKKAPNEETIKAIKEARSGKGTKANNVDDLMAKLNA
jgi:hypothetical protein